MWLSKNLQVVWRFVHLVPLSSWLRHCYSFDSSWTFGWTGWWCRPIYMLYPLKGFTYSFEFVFDSCYCPSESCHRIDSDSNTDIGSLCIDCW